MEGADIPHGFQACDPEPSVLGTGCNGGSDVGEAHARGAAGSETARGQALRGRGIRASCWEAEHLPSVRAGVRSTLDVLGTGNLLLQNYYSSKFSLVSCYVCTF